MLSLKEEKETMENSEMPSLKHINLPAGIESPLDNKISTFSPLTLYIMKHCVHAYGICSYWSKVKADEVHEKKRPPLQLNAATTHIHLLP